MVFLYQFITPRPIYFGNEPRYKLWIILWIEDEHMTFHEYPCMHYSYRPFSRTVLLSLCKIAQLLSLCKRQAK